MTNTPRLQEIQRKTLSFISLMTTVSRGESMRPDSEQSSTTSGRRRERLADAQGWVTPKSPRTMRPAATPPEGPSAAAIWTSFYRRRDHAPAAGLLTNTSSSKSPSVSIDTSCTICSWKSDIASRSDNVSICTFSIPQPVSKETSLSRPDFVKVLHLPSSVPQKRRDQRAAHLRRDASRHISPLSRARDPSFSSELDHSEPTSGAMERSARDQARMDLELLLNLGRSETRPTSEASSRPPSRPAHMSLKCHSGVNYPREERC